MTSAVSLQEVFGPTVEPESLGHTRSVAVMRLVADGGTPGFRLVDSRRTAGGAETLIIEVHVPRPQDIVHPLKAVEPVAVRFCGNDAPAVFSTRSDFPPVPHSTSISPEYPTYLCIDDRPWSEARPSWTPAECLVRIQSWLAKTTRGELHGQDRAPYPLFASVGSIIVLPRSVLERMTERPIELSVHRVDGETRREILIVADDDTPKEWSPVPMTLLALKVPPQDQAQIRYPPRTLRELADLLSPLGPDLLDEIRTRARETASPEPGAHRQTSSARLKAHIAILVAFPMREEGTTTTAGTDLRGFLTRSTLEDIGRRFGWLDSDPDGRVGVILFPAPEPEADDELVPAELHLGFDRELGTLLSGRTEVDTRKVVMVGAGAVGSHVATNLAREGLFTWTVVDDDHLLPHNAARHALYPDYVGTAKARSLAGALNALLSGGTSHIVGNVLTSSDPKVEEIRAALADCDLLLDASASLAVGRYLASAEVSTARRMSFFFNPTGTDAVLLVEPADRSATLRDLEAQYYAEILTRSELDGHLAAVSDQVAYSGACRQATNRMPESRVAALSGLISMAVGDAVQADGGSVQIWRTSGGCFLSVRSAAVSWFHERTGEWRVSLSDQLAFSLAARRAAALPNETGGVLLGVVDTEERSIHLCATLDTPPDSAGDAASFERGVAGLCEAVRAASLATGAQLSYAGEWHSHPSGTDTCPSVTDLVQLRELAGIQAMNGVPGLMLIVGHDGLRLHSGELAEGSLFPVGAGDCEGAG